ncbi:MAG: SDR family NAD(P)-dependent oxidoreductase [Planctomycetota bacterium]|jgi:UDP-glucose 4-epimerase|nr:SDR family NAD(P)-dependent oxidoreductase [Planctomycetota bacterium]
MRIVVTGGCGFIGVNLVDLLQRAGHEVAAIDFQRSVILNRIGHTGPRILGADVRSPGAMWQAIQGADAVVHLAARPGVVQSQTDPAASFHVNVTGTLNVLEACRKTLGTPDPCRRVVLVSSGAAADPKNPYAAFKAATEAMATAYWHSFELEVATLRLTNVYGPWSGDKGSVVSALIKKVLNGEAIGIDGDGTQSRDFVFVGDVCRAILKACQVDREVAGEVLPVGTGVNTSINDLVRELEEIHGSPLTITRTEPRKGEQAAIHDVSHTARVLGWTPAISLQSGLQATYEWFQARPQTPEVEHVTEPTLVECFRPNPDSWLWRIVFHDERGFKKTVEITRGGCQLRVEQLQANPDADAATLREFIWLLGQIPQE